MKVNFNVNVTDFSGQEIKVNGKVVVIADEIQKILFFAGNNGTRLSNDEKYFAYKIGRKIASGEQEYSTEELSFIKAQSGDTLAAGVYGFLCDLIESN